jgi:AcrR family transcriptional regulator
MNWQRARSNEQIQQRVDEIVAATARLYSEHRFEEITIAMIATEAKFTRSNVYRYFKTKEEIFLELLQQDIAAWRAGISETLPAEMAALPKFSEMWVNLLLQHQRMIKLFTILYTVLEPNASLDALVHFKQSLLTELGGITAEIFPVLPFKSPDAAAEFLYAQSALAIGVYPMIDLTPKQKEALKIARLDSHPIDFKEMFTRSIESLLLGLTN